MPPRPVQLLQRTANLRSSIGQTRGSTSCSSSAASRSSHPPATPSSHTAEAAAEEARGNSVLTAGETFSRCLATPTASPIWPLSTPPCTSTRNSNPVFSTSWRPILPLSTAIVESCFHLARSPTVPNFNAGKELPWCFSSSAVHRVDAPVAFKSELSHRFPALRLAASSGLYGNPKRFLTCTVPRTLISRGLHDAQQLGSLSGLAFCARPDEPDAEESPAVPVKEESVLRLLSGACVLPHPDKLDRGGEDAYFILPDLSAAGVADGVGGWADVGIDAGAYARELMVEAEKALTKEPKGCADTLRVLSAAHANTHSQGSCTACLVMLTADRLQAANLGDSGFIVVRNGRIIFRSPPQQHDFNFPFQLGSEGGDSPSAAEVFSLPVAAGDVVVVGTDGLFDNVFDSELASTVMHSLLAGREPQHTAEHIATLARARAQDRIRLSPFARAAQEAGYRYYGGKLDDITVVVSYVAGPKYGPGWWRNNR